MPFLETRSSRAPADRLFAVALAHLYRPCPAGIHGCGSAMPLRDIGSDRRWTGEFRDAPELRDSLIPVFASAGELLAVGLERGRPAGRRESLMLVMAFSSAPAPSWISRSAWLTPSSSPSSSGVQSSAARSLRRALCCCTRVPRVLSGSEPHGGRPPRGTAHSRPALPAALRHRVRAERRQLPVRRWPRRHQQDRGTPTVPRGGPSNRNMHPQTLSRARRYSASVR